MTGLRRGLPTELVQRLGMENLEVKRVGTSVVLQLELEKATHAPCQIIRWNCLALCEILGAWEVLPASPVAVCLAAPWPSGQNLTLGAPF